MEKNEVMLQNDNGTCFMLTNSNHQQYCSYTPKTLAEKKDFYNMINSPSKPLKEMINLEIKLKNVYAETCTYIDNETGETQPGVRIVLIDDKGVSYNTSSVGIFNCLTKIFGIFGEPAKWEKPLNVRVKQLSKDTTKNVLLLELV